MLPELGHFALILALCVAIVQGTLPLIGARRGVGNWMALARPAAWAQFLLLCVAFGFLTHAFVDNDFSVAYVAQNSNSALPLIYRISAVWGGHEGSLLLWGVLLGGWAAAVGVFSRRLPLDMVARVIGIMGLVSIGFLLFTLLTSNPFERLSPAPMDGRDLNPLLQDPGLVLHPPMLYMGYVGFSVAFAFALAALISGRLDAAWARWSRPWTVVAWVFMTLGIALGSWWAYYELGWGGWWFWDPVENASLMPWLVGTALLHSLAVSEKRSAFKSWTVLLAIFTFALVLLGTFLVRSGVITSVHAFASDPGRGIFILVLLGTVVGASLSVYAWRAPTVQSTGRFALLSRETSLLGNNILLVVAAASVLLGTLYPLVLDAFGLGKISVGAPYFNTIFIPLMVPLVFMLGLGPLLRWKRDDLSRVGRSVWIALALCVLSGLLLPWVLFHALDPRAVLGVGLALWVLLTLAIDIHRRTRQRGLWPGMLKLSPSFWGMAISHLGVAVTVIGITLSSHYSIERDIRMTPGEAVVLGEYRFVFEGVQDRSGPNYDASTAFLKVHRDGKEIATLRTEKRLYRVQRMPMTEAGIDAGLFRDLYVAVGEPLDGGAWAMRVYYKPFIRWIWGGALMMSLGGLLVVADRRYRLGARSGTTEELLAVTTRS
ncbi:MAG: heme lyase CcmF/NrfE family subunit [Hydrogenophaga sp.]|nr:heme lyase CcmF/NrfE family subunit [Gammaproteobacteria bacterium]